MFLRNLDLSVYGGSHDEKIGVRLSGLPKGEAVDEAALTAFLQRRAPGSTPFGTARKEPDTPVFLSGVTDFVTDGAPLEAVIRNTNQRSSDYPVIPEIPRPSHADFAAIVKYGNKADLRGGGHFSGRLTAPLCIAGGIALQILARKDIFIGAHLKSVGSVEDTPFDPLSVSPADFEAVRKPGLPLLNREKEPEIESLLQTVRKEGDSVGGQIECAVVGLPVGLGEHMFWGMENRIAHLAFGVPGLKGIEFGEGFSLSSMRGSEANDPFYTDGENVFTATNKSGGIQGGMTNGMPLLFTVAMKPTPSIAKEQDSVNLTTMTNTKITVGGRHDPCIALRAVPVIEAVAALAVLDALLDTPNE